MTASDGVEALRCLRAQREGAVRPSLILLDLMMPNMDGAEFRRELGRDRDLNSIPVVLLSADMSVDEKAQALQAASFVRKPVELETLLDVIAHHLG